MSVMRDIETRRNLPWWQVAANIRVGRQRFVKLYAKATSNIDTNVNLETNRDLIRYLPRAAVVGLFAPFPNLWFETGNSVGSTGRILSGMETLLMYVFEALAMVGLWRGRRELSVWLPFSIAVMGTLALGLVVVNVGTLYRLRYAFLMLLIVLAAGGIIHIVSWSVKKVPMKEIAA